MAEEKAIQFQLKEGPAISVGDKARLRKEFKVVTKRCVALKKKLSAERAAMAVEGAKKLAEELKEEGGEGKSVVRRIDFGADGKAASKMMKVFGKQCPNCSVMIFSREPTASAADENAPLGCYVISAKKDGVDAKAWCSVPMDALNGRCGGKATMCTGQATGSEEQLKKVMVMAEEALANL